MWRTYAAWMDGALESDIALIQAAMNRDGSAVERMSNRQMQLTLNVPAVAGWALDWPLRAAGRRPKCLKRKV
jgi:hypothetical protein